MLTDKENTIPLSGRINLYFTLLFIFPAGVMVNKISSLALDDLSFIIYYVVFSVFLIAEYLSTIGWFEEEKLEEIDKNSLINSPILIILIDTIRVIFLSFHITLFAGSLPHFAKANGDLFIYKQVSISCGFLAFFLLCNLIWNFVVSPRNFVADLKKLWLDKLNKDIQILSDGIGQNLLRKFHLFIANGLKQFERVQKIFFYFISPIFALTILSYSYRIYNDPLTYTSKYDYLWGEYSLYYHILMSFLIFQCLLKFSQFYAIHKIQEFRRNFTSKAYNSQDNSMIKMSDK